MEKIQLRKLRTDEVNDYFEATQVVDGVKETSYVSYPRTMELTIEEVNDFNFDGEAEVVL